MVIFLLFPSFMVYAFAKPLERCIRPMDNTQRQKKACFYFFFSLLYGPGDLSTIFWDKTMDVSIWLPNYCVDRLHWLLRQLLFAEIKQAKLDLHIWILSLFKKWILFFFFGNDHFCTFAHIFFGAKSIKWTAKLAVIVWIQRDFENSPIAVIF